MCHPISSRWQKEATETLPGTRWKVFEQIPRHEHTQVHRGAAAFAEPVISLRIRHVVEPLAEFDQAIDQSFGDLQVRVGLPRAVDDQQVPFKPSAKLIGAARRYPSGFTSGVFM